MGGVATRVAVAAAVGGPSGVGRVPTIVRGKEDAGAGEWGGAVAEIG